MVLYCLVVVAVAAIFTAESINAILLERCNNLEPMIEFYTFSGAPYFRIRSGKLRFKEPQIVDECTCDKTQETNKPLIELCACLKDLENVYAEIQQIGKEEQSRMKTINDLNTEIHRQEVITKQLKNENQQQGSANIKLAQKIDAQEHKLYRLKQEKASVESNLNYLDNILKNDIEQAKTIQENHNIKVVQNVAPVKQTIQIVAKNEESKCNQVKKTDQVAVKIEPKKQILLGTAQNGDDVPQLKKQIVGMESRIEELEKALHVLLNKNGL